MVQLNRFPGASAESARPDQTAHSRPNAETGAPVSTSHAQVTEESHRILRDMSQILRSVPSEDFAGLERVLVMTRTAIDNDHRALTRLGEQPTVAPAGSDDGCDD